MRDAGRIGFDIKGSYDSEMKYEFLDVVYYQNSSYVAKKETIGNAPADNNEFWQILARGESSGGDADASDMTVKFEQATSMTNISTGEKLSSLFGKIKKWFTELPGTLVVGQILTLTDFNQLNNTYRFWKISSIDASYAEEIGIRNVGDFHAFILNYNGDGNTFHFGNIILTSPRLANNDCYKITMLSGVPSVTFSRGYVPSLTNNLLATVPGQSALDAAQGKVLNDRINQINSDFKTYELIATLEKDYDWTYFYDKKLTDYRFIVFAILNNKSLRYLNMVPSVFLHESTIQLTYCITTSTQDEYVLYACNPYFAMYTKRLSREGTHAVIYGIK